MWTRSGVQSGYGRILGAPRSRRLVGRLAECRAGGLGGGRHAVTFLRCQRSVPSGAERLGTSQQLGHQLRILSLISGQPFQGGR